LRRCRVVKTVCTARVAVPGGGYEWLGAAGLPLLETSRRRGAQSRPAQARQVLFEACRNGSHGCAEGGRIPDSEGLDEPEVRTLALVVNLR